MDQQDLGILLLLVRPGDQQDRVPLAFPESPASLGILECLVDQQDRVFQVSPSGLVSLGLRRKYKTFERFSGYELPLTPGYLEHCY